MEPRSDVARRAAREAGALVRAMLGTPLHVRAKEARTDLVTDADTRSEALIRAIVGQSYPDDAILGEETGIAGDPRDGLWIIDPLDGTTNYAHGYRCFCVSIAFERKGQVEIGCVYDPMADELFFATRGGGATCNGDEIHVSGCADLSEAMLVTGFPAHRVDDVRANLAPLADLLGITRAIRRDGSAALDLCYVACGRFDGFWEPSLHAWDVAAGTLIVDEAGGKVTDYRGAPMALDAGRLLATNRKIHAAMLGVVSRYA